MSIVGRVNRMSSVLIKGMKMPRNCSECPVALSGKYCRINKTYTTYIKLPIRPDHCPLVELPEKHGRLIDENEVRTVMNWLLTQPQRPTWNDTYHAIQEMNAVIEAEGDEE